MRCISTDPERQKELRRLLIRFVPGREPHYLRADAVQLARDDLEAGLPAKLCRLLDAPDGAARFVEELPKAFDPKEVALEKDAGNLMWDLVGVYYLYSEQPAEALSIFAAMYDHMLCAQKRVRRRLHKGKPLVRMADCYSALGFAVHAKRYLMLSLCEDALSEQEGKPVKTQGSYLRLVTRQGLPASEYRRYVKEIRKWRGARRRSQPFPEAVLQLLDQNWRTDLPSPAEARAYRVNQRYIEHLEQGLGRTRGKGMEVLAEYLLSCIPGCGTARRQRTPSTEYDIVCALEGDDVDFRSEFGRYFVCECKDWRRPVDFSAFAKFCRVLDSVKCRFGIIFSTQGVSGDDRPTDAERERLKVFQDRGMVVVVVDKADISRLAEGANFIAMLRGKYERVRLDLRPPKGNQAAAGPTSPKSRGLPSRPRR